MTVNGISIIAEIGTIKITLKRNGKMNKEEIYEKLHRRLRETEASLLKNMNSYIDKNYKPDDVHEEYDAGGYIGDPRGCMNEGEVTGFQRAMRVVKTFFMHSDDPRWEE
tara:strand:+ start:1068 stop:1394 length:327 start_codon:yes stop_codon:yes gene_type:complete